MKPDFLPNAFTVIICIALVFFQSKKKIKPIQLQNYVWLIAFIIYLFQIIPYYALNDVVYQCAILFLLFSNFATFIKPVKISYSANRNYISVDKGRNIKTQSAKCIILSIIAWVISIPILSKSIPILMKYGFSEGMNALRYRTYGEYSIFSSLEMVLLTYLIRPIFMVTIIYFSKQIAERNFDIKLLIITFLDALWLVLATAGRALLVSLIIILAIAVVEINGNNLLSILKKYKNYLIPGVILLLFIINIISKRINRNNGLITEGVIYYFSGLSYFSSMINYGLAQPFALMGKGMFSFLIDIPVLILRTIGFNSITGGSQYLSNLANTILPIGTNLKTNATASALFTFYSDFGVFGAAIGGWIIGRIGLYSQYLYTKYKNTCSFCIYIFILYCLLISIQNYPFIGGAPFMTILFIYLMFR